MRVWLCGRSGCCDHALCWRGLAAMTRLTRTSGIATATWRDRLALKGISRGPRKCRDAGHPGRAAHVVLKQTRYESLKTLCRKLFGCDSMPGGLGVRDVDAL